MDSHLKLLADASLEVAAAEDALAEEAFHTAAARIDAAREQLASLREQWASMPGAQRTVVGPAAASVRRRLDAAAQRVPKLTALSVGAAVTDPEQDTQPD